MVRFFVKFYFDGGQADTTKVDLVDGASKLSDLKKQIFEQTNLVASDAIKIIINSIPLTNDSVDLFDESIGASPESTFHVVVNSCKAGKFKVNIPKQVGSISETSALIHLFSFCDFKTLTEFNLVCRKWRLLISNNHLVWKSNAEALFNRHKGDNPELLDKLAQQATEKKDEEQKGPVAAMASPRSSTRSAPPNELWRNLFFQRFIAEKVWEQIRLVSQVATVEPVEPLALKKQREIRLKKKPKPLTDEEQKILKETDVKTLKKNIRKDRKAQEQLKKFAFVEKKQQAYEAANAIYQAIPEKYRLFTYSELMRHTTNFQTGKSKDGFEICYSNGRFYLFKEKILVLIGTLELVARDQFRFCRIIFEDEVSTTVLPNKPTEDSTIVSLFFTLFDECVAFHVSEKKFAHIMVGNYEADTTVDTLYGVQFEICEYTPECAAAPVEPQILPPVKAQEDNKPSITKLSDKKKPTDVKLVLYNSTEANALNEEAIIKTYRTIFTACNKDGHIGHAALPCVESLVSNRSEGIADEVKAHFASQQGALLGQAVSMYLSETTKSNEEEVKEEEVKQHTGDDAQQPQSAQHSKKERKDFRGVHVYVNEAADKMHVYAGLRSIFNK